MKKLRILSIVLSVLFAAGSCSEGNKKTADDFKTSADNTASTSDYDPKRGEGKFNESNVQIGATLDAALAGEGEKVSGVKCASCHKYTEERLVGPGWKGVTERRTPVWVMNFITNPDPMIDKDPEVQAQLELCLVRMPNQGLSDDEARKILEFMRKNDGVQ